MPPAPKNEITGKWKVDVIQAGSNQRFLFLQELLQNGSELTLNVNEDKTGSFELTHINHVLNTTCNLKTSAFTFYYCGPGMQNIHMKATQIPAVKSCSTEHSDLLAPNHSQKEMIDHFPGAPALDNFHFTHTPEGITLNPLTNGKMDTEVEIHFIPQ